MSPGSSQGSRKRVGGGSAGEETWGQTEGFQEAKSSLLALKREEGPQAKEHNASRSWARQGRLFPGGERAGSRGTSPAYPGLRASGPPGRERSGTCCSQPPGVQRFVATAPGSSDDACAVRTGHTGGPGCADRKQESGVTGQGTPGLHLSLVMLCSRILTPGGPRSREGSRGGR